MQLAENYDAVILTVAYREFKAMTIKNIRGKTNGIPILFDLKGILSLQTGWNIDACRNECTRPHITVAAACQKMRSDFF